MEQIFDRKKFISAQAKQMNLSASEALPYKIIGQIPRQRLSLVLDEYGLLNQINRNLRLRHHPRLSPEVTFLIS